MSASEVAQAIDAQNVTLPGGRVDNSRDYLTLRVNGRVEPAVLWGAAEPLRRTMRLLLPHA